MKEYHHKDILKQDIQVDDIVAFTPPAFKVVTFGKVLKINPTGATIEYIHHGITKRCARQMYQLVVITEQYQAARDKYPEEYI